MRRAALSAACCVAVCWSTRPPNAGYSSTGSARSGGAREKNAAALARPDTESHSCTPGGEGEGEGGGSGGDGSPEAAVGDAERRAAGDARALLHKEAFGVGAVMVGADAAEASASGCPLSLLLLLLL